MAGPADGAVFLFDCPVPDAKTVEDVATLQQNGFLILELFETNAAGALVVMISKRLIISINSLLFPISLFTMVDISIQVVQKGILNIVGTICLICRPTFPNAAIHNDHKNCDYRVDPNMLDGIIVL